MVFCDQRAKGFILLTLNRREARGEYVAMSTVFSRDYQHRTPVTAGDAKAALRRV